MVVLTAKGKRRAGLPLSVAHEKRAHILHVRPS